MTRTEDRLADALGAAARAICGDTLRPLQFPQRDRPRPAWIAPVAAAASLLLVVALGVALASWIPGPRQVTSPGTVGAPPRYYVGEDLSGDRLVVRSTVTGAVTATVPVPNTANDGVVDAVAGAGGGVFFVIAFVADLKGQQLYRFRVTDSGRVSGFSTVPGGLVGKSPWEADAIAASPDGSRVAVAFSYQGWAQCPAGRQTCTHARTDTYPDYIVVVDTATGERSVWRGGMGGYGTWFSVASLSWTGNGHELVFLGQLCGWRAIGSESCEPDLRGRSDRTAEVWALDPASGGGRLTSGRVLLRESARYPYIAQAVISPDGSTITALVLAGPVAGTSQVGGIVPGYLSVEQISVATGARLGVLYRHDLGPTTGVNDVPDFLALVPDTSGRYWMLNIGLCAGSCDGGANGWIDQGQLVPLQPADGRLAHEAW